MLAALYLPHSLLNLSFEDYFLPVRTQGKHEMQRDALSVAGQRNRKFDPSDKSLLIVVYSRKKNVEILGDQ
jgi:hypothetical protein